jgi:post-segregation antitoxin (ccd killing protein)
LIPARLRFYLYLMKKEKTERTGKKQVGLEVTIEEKELAERVAKERGLGFSALVRLLIKDEARRLGLL